MTQLKAVYVSTFDQVQCKKYYREYVHAAEQTNKNYSPWF